MPPPAEPEPRRQAAPAGDRQGAGGAPKPV